MSAECMAAEGMVVDVCIFLYWRKYFRCRRRSCCSGAKSEPASVHPQIHVFKGCLCHTWTRECTSVGCPPLVHMKDAVMRYRPELPPVLKGPSMSLSPGEKIGVVGRTGAGNLWSQTVISRPPRHHPLLKGSRPTGPLTTKAVIFRSGNVICLL
ncbi:hypothetical protein EDB19DRAFT_1676385 [Suillus lakei]|nr:hypothetical protein EDB19DRAFT_1676385 [Suillus lakei]